MNWFRRDADGRFLWPGYGENMRILKWMVERIRGAGRAAETPIGSIPSPGRSRAGRTRRQPRRGCAEALRCDAGEWLDALADLGQFYDQFGPRLPAPIAATLAERVAASAAGATERSAPAGIEAPGSRGATSAGAGGPSGSI